MTMRRTLYVACVVDFAGKIDGHEVKRAIWCHNEEDPYC